MTELQRNYLQHVIRTLEYLSDFEQQRRYKLSVPFVHIPNELLEQWSEYRRLLHEGTPWFASIFTEDQIHAIRNLDSTMQRAGVMPQLPDVDEIFSLSLWGDVRDEAALLLSSLQG
jgi:hypothetical protein